MKGVKSFGCNDCCSWMSVKRTTRPTATMMNVPTGHHGRQSDRSKILPTSRKSYWATMQGRRPSVDSDIRSRVQQFPAWPTFQGDRNKTTLLFFNMVSLYFNTFFNWYINLTIDGTTYPSQHFPFGAAFVCQAGNFWTLLRTLNRSMDSTQLWIWRVTANSTVSQDPVHFSVFLIQWSTPNISQGQTAYQRFLD